MLQFQFYDCSMLLICIFISAVVKGPTEQHAALQAGTFHRTLYNIHRVISI